MCWGLRACCLAVVGCDSSCGHAGGPQTVVRLDLTDSSSGPLRNIVVPFTPGTHRQGHTDLERSLSWFASQAIRHVLHVCPAHSVKCTGQRVWQPVSTLHCGSSTLLQEMAVAELILLYVWGGVERFATSLFGRGGVSPVLELCLGSQHMNPCRVARLMCVLHVFQGVCLIACAQSLWCIWQIKLLGFTQLARVLAWVTGCVAPTPHRS